jgi:hypothetical protein
MRIVKTLLTLVIVISVGYVFAQSFNSGKNRKTYKGIKSTFPHHGLGIKLGDPIAVTYKFYLSRELSFGVDFGKVSSSLYNRYYRDKFSEYIDPDTFRTSTASVDYLSHKAKSDLVGEVKVLYHTVLSNLSQNLQFYIGGGWQWKDTRLDYTYQYNNTSAETFGTFSRRRLTMGPQMIAGFEYGDFEIPVAAFLEIEYYKDLQIDPGIHRFEGGVGLRYIF